MILKTLYKVWVPLFSLMIFMLGYGLLSTLLTYRLHLANVSTLQIGLLTTAFYSGLILGSLRIERFITRVGHIRAFATFASTLAVMAMIHGFFVIPTLWIVLRFLSGFASAGLFIVIESWLLITSTEKNRGQVLAFYMIVFYASMALGQFMLNISGVKGLTLYAITTMLYSLSVIPLAMTSVSSPECSEPSALSFRQLYKISPTSIIGCLSAGLIMGAIYGLIPLYVSRYGSSVADVAYYMAVIIFGGMALQYPAGHLSDRFERRKPLVLISAIAAILSILILFISFKNSTLLTIAFFLFGGVCFTLYPLSISVACDYLKSSEIVAATQGLLLSYSIGAAVGPFIAPLFIYLFGERGLFVFFSLIAGFLVFFFLWRIRYYPPVSTKERQAFSPTVQTTPVATELDPRGE